MRVLAQDHIWLGGVKSPGKCTIPSSFMSPRNWTKQPGFGTDGMYCIFTGAGLANFEIGFYLWEDDHKEAWDAFARKSLAKPKRGTRTPPALAISHPVLEMEPFVITSVVVEDVSNFEVDEEGGWSCRVKFLQWRAPVPLLARPTRTISKPGNVPPTAVDAGSQKILELQKQAADPDKLRGFL